MTENELATIIVDSAFKVHLVRVCSKRFIRQRWLMNYESADC